MPPSGRFLSVDKAVLGLTLRDDVTGHVGKHAWKHARARDGGQPVILPILEPATSQKRCRLLPSFFLSLISLTSLEPVLAMTARSEVGSLRGMMASACLVKMTRPSRKGGRVSCTSSMTRTSRSFVKSVSTYKKVWCCFIYLYLKRKRRFCLMKELPPTDNAEHAAGCRSPCRS